MPLSLASRTLCPLCHRCLPEPLPCEFPPHQEKEPPSGLTCGRRGTPGGKQRDSLQPLGPVFMPGGRKGDGGRPGGGKSLPCHSDLYLPPGPPISVDGSFIPTFRLQNDHGSASMPPLFTPCPAPDLVWHHLQTVSSVLPPGTVGSPSPTVSPALLPEPLLGPASGLQPLQSTLTLTSLFPSLCEG